MLDDKHDVCVCVCVNGRKPLTDTLGAFTLCLALSFLSTSCAIILAGRLGEQKKCN